jgi:hypothetical protein
MENNICSFKINTNKKIDVEAVANVSNNMIPKYMQA